MSEKTICNLKVSVETKNANKCEQDVIDTMHNLMNQDNIEHDKVEINPITVNEEQTKDNKKTDTLVSTSISCSEQWYEKDPRLFEAEKVAMFEFMGDNAKLGYLDDGRAFWHVHLHPRIANKPLNKCREYDLLLVYNKDHPKTAMGASVKVYPIKPSFDEMQEIVNSTPGVYPKKISHVIRDEDDEIVLSVSNAKMVSACSINSSQGIPSAATYLRGAIRWINCFELGLEDSTIWRLFYN